MIGDVLASSIICSALKQARPCEVHYMINRNTFPVVENHPDVDKFILTDPEQNKISDFIRLGKRLREARYDAIIDAYGIWESIIPTYVSKAPVRIGFRKWYTRVFYTKLVTPKKHVAGSAIHHRLQLAQAYTGMFAKIDFPKIHLTDEEILHAKSIIAQHASKDTPLIMISLLGSGADKSLPASSMARTLDVIADAADVQMALNYIPSQESDAAAIIDLCRPATRDKIIRSMYTRSLREFLAVLSQCDALIGNEGGAVNMAKALDIPTFTVFSPWINKDSWNMLEDDARHVAIHLNDFHPDIYKGVHPKKFRVQAAMLYQMLKPELFAGKLVKFVKSIAGSAKVADA